MLFKKYVNYLIIYTIHYVDKIKNEDLSIKATGRVIKSIKGGIKDAIDLVKIETEIRAHFLRSYPTLTECYITHYQKISKTREKDAIKIMDRIELLSKEQILTTLSKFVDCHKSDKDIEIDKTDEHILDVINDLKK